MTLPFSIRRLLLPLCIVLIFATSMTAVRANLIVVTTTVQAAVDAASPGDTFHAPPGTNPEAVRANVIVVTTTIQAAVDVANPGDTVHVPPGTYPENVSVAKNNISITADPGAIMDGTGLSGGLGIRVYSADPNARINGFSLSGLQIQNYKFYGIELSDVDNFRLRDGIYINNGNYGIFPVHSSNGLIDFNTVSGSNDTGIYIGQSADVSILSNTATSNTVGINVENSSRVRVQANTAISNSIGIMVDIVPNVQETATQDIDVANNQASSNNRPNPFIDPTDLLSQIPSGLGIVNVGGDRVTIRNNIADRNVTNGILIERLPPSFASQDARIDPFPDNNIIRDNEALYTGTLRPVVRPLAGADLQWDSTGSHNCWIHNSYNTSSPLLLPVCTFPVYLPLVRR